MRTKPVAIFAILTMWATTALSEQGSEADDKQEALIRNGCVNNMNIKRVKFDSRTTGIMELTGGKKVRITLKAPCTGIKNEGYVHKPINNQFCEGDILRVINYGNVCVVDTLEPYTEEVKEQSKSVEGTDPASHTEN